MLKASRNKYAFSCSLIYAVNENRVANLAILTFCCIYEVPITSMLCWLLKPRRLC